MCEAQVIFDVAVPTPLEQELEQFFNDFLQIPQPFQDDPSQFSKPAERKQYFRERMDKYLKNYALIKRLKDPGLFPLLRIAQAPGHACFEALQVLLESMSLEDIELRDHSGRTALSYAAELQSIQYTKLLLDYGADPNSKDIGGRTPFSWAVTPGLVYGRILGPRRIFPRLASANVDVIACLLLNGADINSEDHEKRTPLIWAMTHIFVDTTQALSAQNAQRKTVDQLLMYEDIDVCCQDSNGQTPLILAAKGESYHLMELLIDQEADTTKRDLEGCTCFWRLLEARKRSQSGRGPAFKDRVFSLIRKAGGYLVRWDKDNCTLLSWAVEFQDANMVEALLKEGVDPEILDQSPSDSFSKTPLLRALERGNYHIISLFIPRPTFSSSSEIHHDQQKDKTTLHLLIQKSDLIGDSRALELLKKLLQTRYAANTTDLLEGRTPLHYAIDQKKESLAMELIQNLSAPALNVEDNRGKTPLLYALENKMIYTLQYLVRCGANIDLSKAKIWFDLGGSGLRYIRFTQNPRSSGFKLIGQCPNKHDWLPNAGENILCFHKEGDREWSRLRQRKEFPQQNYEYIHYACLKSRDGLAEWIESHISVSFPNEENIFQGIEWSAARGKGSGFVTTIPSSTFPVSWKEFCKQFLDYVQQKWENVCSDANKNIENIRQKQLEKQGRSRKIIHALAQNSLTRAKFRRYLQQHVVGLRRAVKDNFIIKPDDEKDLIEIIDNLNGSVKARLDSLEQAAKEILQIEFAWVSVSEATSLKRISWVTFIFLPLMFASSLFGMNVNILADNPDWKWYLIIGASSLLLTVALWVVLKFISTKSWVDVRSFLFHWRRKPAIEDVDLKV